MTLFLRLTFRIYRNFLIHDAPVSSEGQGLFAVLIFAVAVTEGDFSAMDLENPIIGQRHAVDVTAEVVQHINGRAERFLA